MKTLINEDDVNSPSLFRAYLKQQLRLKGPTTDYEAKNHDYGVAPDWFVMNALRYKRPKLSVLDLGGGYGRNSIPIAKMGHSVTCIDISNKAIAMLKEDAQAAGVKVHTEVSNILSRPILKNYDVILLVRLLHNLPSEDGRKLIDSVQRHTNPNGLNIVETILGIQGLLGRVTYVETDLMPQYKKWKILEYGTGRTLDKGHYPEMHLVAKRI